MNYFYLIHIQYLGFRYHGWQKQPKFKTVHFMVDKTIEFIFKDRPFKTHGTSRTDAKVSANHSAFELFLSEPVDLQWFQAEMNDNLPGDIRILRIEEVDKNFNIIKTPRLKEYLYLFACGEKPHPFSAALVMHFKENLDIELMKEGALLFQGKHNFINYCSKPAENTEFNREILVSKIEENTLFTANFFPEKSYLLHLHSKGFMRYQARLIMAQLIRLGKHEIDLDYIRMTLRGDVFDPVNQIAPSSGLLLNALKFDL